MMVARFKLKVARRSQGFGFFFIPGKPFINQSAHDRSARGPAHALPRDGRSGMQDEASAHPWDHIPGKTHSHQHRPGVNDPLACFTVCIIDGNPILRPHQIRHDLARWLPIQPFNNGSLLFQGRSHAIQSKVQYLDFLTKKVFQKPVRHVHLRPFTKRAARRAA